MFSEQKRHIVLPIELTEGSDRAVKYFLEHLYKDGDVLNLVHVVKASEPLAEVYHGPVGTSLAARDPLAETMEAAAIDRARESIATRFTKEMDEKGVLHNLHLYLDTVNTPPSAIAVTVDKVCKIVDAAMIVMATHNKGTLEKLFVGSVADYLAANSVYPVVLVR